MTGLEVGIMGGYCGGWVVGDGARLGFVGDGRGWFGWRQVRLCMCWLFIYSLVWGYGERNSCGDLGRLLVVIESGFIEILFSL